MWAWRLVRTITNGPGEPVFGNGTPPVPDPVLPVVVVVWTPDGIGKAGLCRIKSSKTSNSALNPVITQPGALVWWCNNDAFIAFLASVGVDIIPAARAQSRQARSHMSAAKMRIQILNVSAQMTIRIDTTAASSMAVIPLNLDTSPLALRLFGD